MDVHLFGADKFEDLVTGFELTHPGFATEFEGTLSMMRYRGKVGHQLAGSSDELYSFLYDEHRTKIGVVVTSVSKSPGSLDVEIVDVCTYDDWVGGREEVITKQLGLG